MPQSARCSGPDNDGRYPRVPWLEDRRFAPAPAPCPNRRYRCDRRRARRACTLPTCAVQRRGRVGLLQAFGGGGMGGGATKTGGRGTISRKYAKNAKKNKMINDQVDRRR